MVQGTTVQTLGMAALVVASLASGFLVASTVSTQAFSTVGTVDAADRAYALALTDERVRFTLEATGASSPSAGLAVYDPQDTFFGYFELAGHGDTADIVADEPGRWVILISEARAAEIAVDVASTTSNRSLDGRLIPLKVTSSQRVVADQQGGELDVSLGFRLDHRPAIATLHHDADARALSAKASSPVGTVYTIEDQRTNRSSQGHEGVHTASPGNLAKGLYRIEATAEAFSGTLTFVYKSYEREPLDQAQTRPLANATLEQLKQRGAVVATLDANTPVVFDTHGAERLILAADEHTSAKVRLYDPTDSVERIVQIGQEGPTFDFTPEDENRSNIQSLSVPLARTGAYVAYASQVTGESTEVTVILDGIDDAAPGRELDLERTRVQLGGSEDQYLQAEERARVTIYGGLVNVKVESQSPAHADMETVITGPDGLVYERWDQAGALGAEMSRQATGYPGNFTRGEHVIDWEASTDVGGIQVDLFAYHR